MMEPVDKVLIQQNKINKIQGQIEKVEQQMMEQSSILGHIEHLHGVEEQRTKRIMHRLGKRNYVLNNEVERLYGKQNTRRFSDTPLGSGVMNDIMYHRTKEHSLAQQEASLKIQYLKKERQRLQDARERLRERRNNLTYAPSPVGSDVLAANPNVSPNMLGVGTPSEHSAHSAGSYVRRAVDDLPYAMDRIYRLREEIRAEYETKKRPYNGELGLETYDHWQLGDYVIVRKLVEDIIDDFLIHYIKPDIHIYEAEMRHAIVQAENEDWERTAGALAERRAVTLVAEELMLLATRELSREVAQETVHIFGTFHNFTTRMLLNTVESISTGQEKGRDPEDPAFNLVSRGYFSMQTNRNQHRKDIWAHTQHLHHIKPQQQHPQPRPQQQPQKAKQQKQKQQPKPQQHVEPEEEEEDVDADVEVIKYDHIKPMSLRKYESSRSDSKEVNRGKEFAKIYHKREQQYWKGLKTAVKKLIVGRKCKGVQTARVSHDQRFLALGTAHGDLVVYDTWMAPWRPVRAIHNIDRANDGVIDIAWSMDGSRLSTINTGGMLIVWSFDGGGTQRSDVRGLDIQADSAGYIPQQLARIALLDGDKKDFTYQQGPFSEQDVLSSPQSPVKGAFFPSFTLLGTQHSVCACLDNGDMLKCNLEPLSVMADTDQTMEYSEAPTIYHSNIYDASYGINLIGQGLEAELFRQHKHPIIYIGFVDKLGNIVTVDIKGFINMWKYDRQHISGFGWFLPQKKYRIQMSKIMFSPSRTEKPNVIFTDKIKQSKKTRQDVARERKKLETTLQNMQLGDPWHETFMDDQGLQSTVYAPKGEVKESGAMFHVILRYQGTSQISTYLTRLYKPEKVKCSGILEVCQTSSGRDMVFLLLYPQFPPKDAHMTVLVLDLRTMKLKDIRRDIPLTDAEYKEVLQKDVVSCDVSRVFGPTGSEYLFLTFNGRLRVLSLNTGKLVMRAENVSRPSYFGGNALDERLLPLQANAEVTTVCSGGRIYAVLYSMTSTVLHILEVRDEHDHDTRRMMIKAYQTGYDTEMVGSEIRVDPVAWQQNDLQHKTVEMQKLVMEAVDNAVGHRGRGTPSKSQQLDQALKDKTEMYLALEDKVDSAALLDGVSPDERRRAER
ncbi:uncharacterized protein LOC124119841 [Haliotis rufescens]|uniref:uncharacterized protein LOC124119841 n=1 Tax=Haliotis rufescens TaxID=6454 RepID=UPI00201ED595|nr:uncharacterized protein LOC124119841 [Haliotis rufescens]XP_048246891.1 uncharacterized protein LOC124119841 [Haliotis rufescens]